jgi:precorrin-2/cobalt-factor-2 C20-methyltransferase
VRLLQQAPVVAFPAGVSHQQGMAERIIAPWLLPGQIQLPLSFPYVQNQAVLQQAWQTAAGQVWPYLQQGQDVAFACEGDVSFYSTFTYLAQTLSQLHPEVSIQVVPGVSSPLAVAAVLGIPLATGSQRLAILPALYRVAELEAVLDWADVAVLMKVASVYEEVWQVLHRRNLLNRAWVVERATLAEQVVYGNLGDCPRLNLSYFSLLVIQVR